MGAASRRGQIDRDNQTRPLGVTGVRLWIVAMPLIGAALVRFGPDYKLRRRMR